MQWTDEDYELVRAMVDIKMTTKEIANETGYSIGSINLVRRMLRKEEEPNNEAKKVFKSKKISQVVVQDLPEEYCKPLWKNLRSKDFQEHSD